MIEITADMARLVPELLVTDFDRSLEFYTQLIGFNVLYSRPEERFAYLDLGGAQVMLDEFDEGDDRSWRAAALEQPFGRGINLQITVADAGKLFDSCIEAGADIFLPMEEKWYRRDEFLLGVRQFIAQDPDGYLLRLSQHIGMKPVEQT